MLANPNHQLRIAADRRDDDRHARGRARCLADPTPAIDVSTASLLRWLSVQPIVRRMRRVGHAI